jgi:hypothetical protein
MFWRANHPAGARELVAQIFLSILALRVNFAALPNRGLRARFRAFRIYLLQSWARPAFSLRAAPERLQLPAATTQKSSSRKCGFRTPLHAPFFGSRIHAALKENGSASVRVPVGTENLNPHVRVMKPAKDWM